jgi:hypothetical protein
MTLSVLLRLVSEALAQGRVAGHAEVVDTGETVVFKDQDEMLAFLQGASAHGATRVEAPTTTEPFSPPSQRGNQ